MKKPRSIRSLLMELHVHAAFLVAQHYYVAGAAHFTNSTLVVLLCVCHLWLQVFCKKAGPPALAQAAWLRPIQQLTPSAFTAARLSGQARTLSLAPALLLNCWCCLPVLFATACTGTPHTSLPANHPFCLQILPTSTTAHHRTSNSPGVLCTTACGWLRDIESLLLLLCAQATSISFASLARL